MFSTYNALMPVKKLIIFATYILLITTVGLSVAGCSKSAERVAVWQNAYDVERELYLLGQQDDPREIYRRLQGIKQQASMQLSQLRERGRRDPLLVEWLESLTISLSMAPLYSDKIATCDIWKAAMEKAWGVSVSQFNEPAKLVWRVMVATCNARVRSL